MVMTGAGAQLPRGPARAPASTAGAWNWSHEEQGKKHQQHLRVEHAVGYASWVHYG